MPEELPSAKHVIKRGVPAVSAALGAVAVMIFIYWYMPVPQESESPLLVVAGIVILALVYGVAGVGAVVWITRSSNPLRVGLVLLAVMVTAVVVIFALTYLSLSSTNPQNFNVALDKVSSLYFTMTILSTVGFGDIHAQTHAAMIAVMLQMVLGLSLITVMARVLVASTRSATRKQRMPK